MESDMKIFNKLFTEAQPKPTVKVIPKEPETEYSIQEQKVKEILKNLVSR